MPTIEADPTTIFRSFELQELVDSGEISPELARKIGQEATYAVLFGSEQLDDLSEDIKEELKDVDDASYDEAFALGGLVAYIRGSGQIAYSACFWKSKEDAARAMHGPHHRTRAVPLAQSGRVYKQWFIKFNDITPDSRHGFVATRTHISGHDFDKRAA